MNMDAASVVQVVEAVGPEIAWLWAAYPHPYFRIEGTENNSVADLFEKAPATRNLWPAVTTLIPPGTQYSATYGKPEKGKPPKYAGFASPCKPLQHMNYHS
jgi:hypothetical protein